MKIYSDEIHHRIVKKFKRRKVLVSHIDHVWASDLAIMNPEIGYRYILVIVVCFSKHLWCECLKTKSTSEVKESFEKVFKESNRKPQKLWTVKDKYYYSNVFQKFLEENNIELYSTEHEGKSMVAERVILTLKNKTYRKFTELGDNKHWVKILPEITNEYNNTVHSITSVSNRWK